MKTLNLVILLTGIALPLVIYLILKIVHYNPKISNSYTNRQKTITSQPNIKNKNTDDGNILTNIIWILVLSLIILIGVFIARGVKKLVEPKQKAKTEIITPEPVYENDYQLKKGSDIIIHIKPNYHYGYEGYGKKYYRQSFYQNGQIGPKDLIGGGLPLKHNGKESVKVIKAILSVYEEEGKITVYHSKDLNELMKK